MSGKAGTFIVGAVVDILLIAVVFGGEAARKYDSRELRAESRQLEARVIAKSKLATAMIDSSDGLVRSVLELSKASQVGALIYGPEVPIAPGATLQQALHGGEEYELVFTAPMKAIPGLKKLLKSAR